jgi:hypothetical protein
MREKGGGAVRRWGRNEKGRRKSDLKAGHVRAKNGCDRMYINAFDRIRAECVYVKGALCSNVQGTFKRMHVGVCVCDRVLRSNQRK